MPVIELNVSDQVYLRWLDFRASQQAARLQEAGVLGDWVLVGFMNQANDYLKAGGPLGAEDAESRRERLEAKARNKLSKPQKRVLPMFDENETVTLAEISGCWASCPRTGPPSPSSGWPRISWLRPRSATPRPPSAWPAPGGSATWRPTAPRCTPPGGCIFPRGPSRAPTKSSFGLVAPGGQT